MLFNPLEMAPSHVSFHTIPVRSHHGLPFPMLLNEFNLEREMAMGTKYVQSMHMKDKKQQFEKTYIHAFVFQERDPGLCTLKRNGRVDAKE